MNNFTLKFYNGNKYNIITLRYKQKHGNIKLAAFKQFYVNFTILAVVILVLHVYCTYIGLSIFIKKV